MNGHKRGTGGLRWVVLSLLLLGLAAAIWWGLSGPARPIRKEKPDDASALTPAVAGAVFDPAAGIAVAGPYQGKSREEVLAELMRKQKRVTDTLSSHAVFTSGGAGTWGEWMVENIADNEVVQQAEIMLGDRCVARSAALLPGQHVTTVRLLADVAPGTHEAYAFLNYFTTDTHTYISKTGFRIHLTVGGEQKAQTSHQGGTSDHG